MKTVQSPFNSFSVSNGSDSATVIESLSFAIALQLSQILNDFANPFELAFSACFGGINKNF